MDTILTDEASLLSSSPLSRPKARLPGESVLDMLRHTPEQEPSPQVPRERLHRVSRKALLAAAGLFVIVGTIVSVGYLERARLAHLPFLHRDVTAQPQSHVKPAIAGNDVTLPPPIHPQAAAAVPPVHPLVDEVAPPPAKPAPGLQQPVGNGQPIAGPATGKPPIAPSEPNAQTDLREFTALQDKTPAPPTAINRTVPQPGAPPGDAAKPTPTAAPGQTETRPAPAPGAAVPPPEQHTAPAHAPPQAAKPAPVDPVAEATSLRARSNDFPRAGRCAEPDGETGNRGPGPSRRKRTVADCGEDSLGGGRYQDNATRPASVPGRGEWCHRGGHGRGPDAGATGNRGGDGPGPGVRPRRPRQAPRRQRHRRSCGA